MYHLALCFVPMKKSTFVLPIVLLTAGCVQAATPAADAGKLAACVLADWGKPVETVAHDCTNDAVPLAIDIIAILSETLSKSPTGAPAAQAYRGDARVMARWAALAPAPVPAQYPVLACSTPSRQTEAPPRGWGRLFFCLQCGPRS